MATLGDIYFGMGEKLARGQNIEGKSGPTANTKAAGDMISKQINSWFSEIEVKAPCKRN